MLRPHPWISHLVIVGCACATFVAGSGCGSKKNKTPTHVQLDTRYATLPAKQVPPLFKDTVLEKCDLINTEPFLVSGYGVVANLANTGASEAHNLVRQYIVKEMDKHKWGSSLIGIKMPDPMEALKDPRLAIVQVDGYLPPGVRKGQRFDIQVSALPESSTTSLAQGDLFQTELRVFGANPADPGGAVNVFARAEGPVFVNPAYALDANPQDPNARRSLRMGVIMNGAASLQDRPLGLRLRQPSMRLCKFIESRVDQRLQEVKPDTIADAQDEAICFLFVPPSFNGDIEHFVGLVTHLYLNGSIEFATKRAQQLAEEALKPGAPLMDISYCWEALGKVSLATIREHDLMANPDPDVSYAAARAAAYLEDTTAPSVLVKIATTPGHKFQVNAITVLGSLRSSPEINELLRPLLNSEQTVVRQTAYEVLSRNGDNSVYATPLKAGFIMDVVQSNTAPVIYGTRRGEPRLAVMGNRVALEQPVAFSAMNGRLTISSNPDKTVTIFYRPPMPAGGPRTQVEAERLSPIVVRSHADIVEIIARLAGEGFENQPVGRRLDFNYGEILSILSKMTASRQLTALASSGEKMPASFILQDVPIVQDSIYNAPVIPDHGRPQSDRGEHDTATTLPVDAADAAGAQPVGMAK